MQSPELNETEMTKIYPVFVLLIIGSCVFFYYDVMIWMYERFISPDSYYSHSFLIPFISGFFIWEKREELVRVKPEISWWGLIIVLISVLMHIFGTLLYVFSISGFSIFFLIFGSVLFLFGPTITKRMWFPLFFLIFMFPLPLSIINTISFPMKMLVAKAGVAITSILGVPVFREGFNITIPGGNLIVENPCSGLRSLIAFLALGAVFAYVSNMSIFKKIILFLLSIPVAILSNMIRVPILIIISHYYGLEAASPEAFWHNASGMFVFAIGFLLLIAIRKVFEWKI